MNNEYTENRRKRNTDANVIDTHRDSLALFCHVKGAACKLVLDKYIRTSKAGNKYPCRKLWYVCTFESKKALDEAMTEYNTKSEIEPLIYEKAYDSMRERRESIFSNNPIPKKKDNKTHDKR